MVVVLMIGLPMTVSTVVPVAQSRSTVVGWGRSAVLMV
jgi:hypothetical protein